MMIEKLQGSAPALLIICWYKTITLYLGNRIQWEYSVLKGQIHFIAPFWMILNEIYCSHHLLLVYFKRHLTRFIPSWLLNFIDPSLWKFMWNSLAILGSWISFWTSKSLLTGYNQLYFMKRCNHLLSYFLEVSWHSAATYYGRYWFRYLHPSSPWSCHSALKVEEGFTSMPWF